MQDVDPGCAMKLLMRPAGDSAVWVCCGDLIDPEINDCILSVVRAIRSAGLPGIEEVIPS